MIACKTCVFFDETGECRRSPPVVVPNSNVYSEFSTQFPQVEQDSYCHEHKEKIDDS